MWLTFTFTYKYLALVDVRHLIFLLLFYIGAGFFVSMGVLRPSQMGQRYFLYHGLGATLFNIGAWLVLGDHPNAAYVEHSILWFVFFSAGYSVTAGKHWWISTFFYILGLTSAFFTLVADLIPDFSEGSELFPSFGYFLTNGLLSTLLLGFSLAAMIVGHWYLIQPKLSIQELRRTTIIFIGLVGLRFLVSTWGIVNLSWDRSEIELYRYFFGGYPGLFILMRWLWGLLGPALLCYFIWSTVKIRSTQSATGILYVAVVCVLTGEILSQYLTFFHGIPL